MAATQRNAIVTGGMGGLGEAICMKLARMGIKVIVTYSPSNTKAADWLKEMAERDYHFHAYPVDVANFDSCASAIAKIQGEVGPIDILINNAGITRDMTVKKKSTVSPRRWRWRLPRRGLPSTQFPQATSAPKWSWQSLKMC